MATNTTDAAVAAKRHRYVADPDDIGSLVQPDRVHGSVFTAPAIFELAMDFIFGRAWVFFSHESQVAKPGDFFTTHLGRQPVIVCRDKNLRSASSSTATPIAVPSSAEYRRAIPTGSNALITAGSSTRRGG